MCVCVCVCASVYSYNISVHIELYGIGKVFQSVSEPYYLSAS